MMLTAACTNRKTFPNMEEIEPFNVIYQTAEDGMGDTIKPRLVEAGADLSRVMVIDDTEEARMKKKGGDIWQEQQMYLHVSNLK